MLGPLELFFGLLSVLLISFIAYFAWKNRAVTSCSQLLLTCCATFVWLLCVWLECTPMFVGWQKLICLTLSQIGALYVVPAFFSYVLYYTGFYRPLLKRVLAALYVWETFVLALVFTNPFHHLIWKAAELKSDRFGELLMQLTTLGNFAMLLNYAVNIISVSIIVFFWSRAQGGVRTRARTIMLAASVFILYAFVHAILPSGRNVLPPIPFMFFISALIGLFGIWQYDLTSLVPIAYQEVFQIIDEGVIIFLESGEVLNFNRAMQDIFALHVNDVIQNDRKGRRRMQRLIEERFPNWRGKDGFGNHQFDVRLKAKCQNRYYHCRIYPFHNQAYKVVGSIAVIRDMTTEHDQTQILQEQAERDGLTGIYNRQTFTRLAEQQLRQGAGPWSVLYFDMDYFKRINDTCGHIFGDQVLCETCTCVAAVIGEKTLFCRAGGEEFMVFLRGYTAKEARLLAEAMRKEVEGHMFVHEGVIVPVTISVGVVTAYTLTFDDYYRYADQMLYQAKSEGRNCVRVWSEEDGAEYGQEG
ncbi:diguanylate cyclase [Ethanoligenens harbinense YUAN-3]|uniref:Diguanylate cyclase n=1 Tax=Ethanoligenens harbinense (strain DSM 18485 / JCM 12961 / CGMCC 1.5033 / YUAN-3) TaxID=663278 RepID=E6U2U7_ETHHY|nr:diguanylate cyclase [Ethanoligenens harbinense YUAN-3]